MDFAPSLPFAGPIDRKASTFSLHDAASLDSSILDTPTLMSPSASSQGIFSPNPSMPWDDLAPFADRAASAQASSSTSNPFFDSSTHHQHAQNNNPFTRLPANQAATYGQQPAAWPDSAGARTPTAPKPLHPFGHADYDAPSSAFVPAAAASHASSFSLPVHSVRPSSVFQAAPDRPLSPHNNSEWMALNQQELESRAGPKRSHAASPPRPYSPRRDAGIRKKNARFDIPSDRNLYNIDRLISEAATEDDIRELKQQKRLLRNRQAALDSRQRKKKHTEELEEEKKMWAERMSMLEDEVGRLRLQNDSLVNEKHAWHHEHAAMQEYVAQLQWDKEEMVRNHTLETGELRKKVSVLVDRLDTATAPSLAPSSAVADFPPDMDGLHAGAIDWDSYAFDGELCVDDTPSARPEQSLVVARKGQDQPVASGLLLMLLLCGAFVASKSSGSAAPPIPRMPDDVRAASATVLNSIFQDAGVAPSVTLEAAHVHAAEPAPSAIAWPPPQLALAGSTLDQLHSQLAMPSKEQERDQLFSMTPSQYNSFTTVDFTRPRYSLSSDDVPDPLSPGSQPSPSRRNLAQTLAAMREANKGDTAAEVYTRSLLWDKIPTEVVHEFKRMVEESDRVAVSRPATSGGGLSEAEAGG